MRESARFAALSLSALLALPALAADLRPVKEPAKIAAVFPKTAKLRVVNVWATWCAPCVAEFPGLVSISRRLANRDFELITISVDDANDRAKVQQFLEKQRASVPNRVQRSVKAEGRGTNNYHFTGADLDALMHALDPESPGPVPYTLIIAPDGKILHRQSGEIDVAELQLKLIDTLGAYYTSATGR